MKQKTGNRWLIYLLPAFLYGCFTSCAFCQTGNHSAVIVNELLTSFSQVENSLPVSTATCCNLNNNWTIAERLAHAEQYDCEGNWKSCEAILNNLSDGIEKFTPAEKLHFILAKASYYNNRQLFDSAKAMAAVVCKQASKNEWLPEKAKAFLILSYGALKTRDIFLAYGWADSALQLSRKANSQLLEGKALLQMAFCARRNFTSATGRAFPYYLQALEAAAVSGDSATLFYSDIYFATDNFEVNNWPLGMQYFRKAVAIATAGNNLNFAYTVRMNGGYTMMQQGLSKQAMILYKQSLSIAMKQQLPYNIKHAYNQIAGTFQEIKEYDSALFYADLAEAVAGVDSFYTDIPALKAGIYTDMGNYKAAAAMYAKALSWSNQDFLYRNQVQLSSYEARLKTAEKELEVGQERKRRMQLEWFTGGAIVLLIVAAWAYLSQKRGRHKLYLQNTIIENQRAALEKSVAEKDMLLKEIHHRVKNNLSVISSLLELQSGSLEDEKAKAAITEGQNRVQSIALIHQRLYQHENLAAIELADFIKDMISQVSGIFKLPGQKISTDIQVPETLLDIDTAVPVGLILNELLTNSFKYAFSTAQDGLIRIQLSSAETGSYVLCYNDNGPGMPAGTDLKKSKSLGLRLIHRLSNQIGGTAVYSSAGGAAFVITFKDSLTRNQQA